MQINDYKSQWTESANYDPQWKIGIQLLLKKQKSIILDQIIIKYFSITRRHLSVGAKSQQIVKNETAGRWKLCNTHIVVSKKVRHQLPIEIVYHVMLGANTRNLTSISMYTRNILPLRSLRMFPIIVGVWLKAWN